MLSSYPWYALVGPDDGLEQGDLVLDCPIVEPVHEIQDNTIKTHLTEYDVVVMSQSCDLRNNKLSLVLVCPFWPLKTVEQHNPWLRSPRNKEKLRKGHQPNYHMLDKPITNGILAVDDFLIVDFRSVFSVPTRYVMEYVASTPERIRLLPPYKEHLAQSFSRFFMRVGLPIDIRPFT